MARWAGRPWTSGPGSHRFELRTATATATSRPASAAPSCGAATPRERLEPDDDDRRYKPGFWKQDTTFLEAVRAGRQPDWPSVTLADAHVTMVMLINSSASRGPRDGGAAGPPLPAGPTGEPRAGGGQGGGGAARYRAGVIGDTGRGGYGTGSTWPSPGSPG